MELKFLKSLPLVFVCLFLRSSCYAQDIHFSQFFSAPLILNPALTGSFKGKVRAVTNYRNQWTQAMGNNFETFSISVDAPVYKEKFFSGLYVYSDKSGDSKMISNSANLSLASRIALDYKNNLTFGINTGWVQKKIDLTQVTWNSQYDGNTFNGNLPSGENITSSSFSYVDFSAGVFWDSEVTKYLKLNGGISSFHINSPKQSFYGNGDKLYTKWVVHGSSEIGFKNSNITYIPTFMLLKQGPTNEFDIGIIAKYNLGFDSKYTGINKSSNILFGCFYRNKDAFNFYMGYDQKGRYAIGISYDINVSDLRQASYYQGGFEVCLLYKFYNSHVTVNTK